MNTWRVQPLIHVVDDDEAVRSSLTLLGEARGWRVRGYASAQDYLATSFSGEGRPECLVLDLQMPGMNGAELLETLSSSGKHPPAVVLTAWPDGDLARRAAQAGARRILAKPFSPRDWLNAVEESLIPA
ncbi:MULTISPECIES: response regulator transcription factor [unclassified Wenzhouxiangella]|uniref:response regulator transcription factor n=1 Tax=unclassified Wenzhouxiangella TaxID=2613841 RepID=UPI000E3273F2|nr:MULTISPECIES: response regulator [unclassified Wenzhouxiangella]RFF26860.1 response regulator [Wenzhouxiangella sp. 15181]RFP68486.1 response regulator [Wenzhouxiangella sp. 15190]